MGRKKMVLAFLACLAAVTTYGQGLKPFEGTNGQYGYKDAAGKVVIEPKYTFGYPFAEGLAVVSVDSGYGFIDETGKLAIPAKYQLAYGFSEGLAAVRYNDKWGFIDQSGNEVIPFIYYLAVKFEKGRAFVFPKRKGKGFFINKKGEKIK